MKKLTALLLSVVLVLSLAACGSANKPASSTTQPENGKTLVVYYSASGNTERVAKDIAEAAGADLFEIVPTEVYTSEDLNWTNSDSRVSREHDDESLRDVPLTTTEVPDWDSYDTVFIGYPIWWDLAPRIINTFIESHDLKGKTVIPFATSGGSTLAGSAAALKKTYPALNWREGRLLNRADEKSIRNWVDNCKL